MDIAKAAEKSLEKVDVAAMCSFGYSLILLFCCARILLVRRRKT